MAHYVASPEQQKVIGEMNSFFEKARRDRQPHERTWFVNASMLRGQQRVVWNDREQKVETPSTPAHRVTITVNRILPKVRARRAKFLKNRPNWVVIPATTDQEDKMNARATGKALSYQYRKLKVEGKYRRVLRWTEIAGKGYLWYYWDETLGGRIRKQDPVTGQESIIETPNMGDICLEVGSPFEVLVADPTIDSLGDQPKIMRVTMRPLEELKARYPKFAEVLVADNSNEDTFKFERQIGALNASGTGSPAPDRKSEEHEGEMVIVKEEFCRPTAVYPKGQYRVLLGNILVKDLPELPYGFHDLNNPFPVTEFSDLEVAGQYWGTTLVEQLIGIQREYNFMRSALAEHLRMLKFPKLLVAKQHMIPKSAWTTEAGEVIEFIYAPGMPPPQPWHPPGISSDVWRVIELIKGEIEDITQIYPASEGKVGAATSGFQTNLLQEATDSVHAPDTRSHEIAFEEAGIKMRRMMKMGYPVPRLITAIGRQYEPDVLEFSSNQIDENADIIVETGSALPDLKAARMESVGMLFEKGLLGDPSDPEVRRRALTMMELGSTEEAYDFARTHEDLAKIENIEIEAGKQVAPPEFCQDHRIHYQIHCDKLSSLASRHWPPERRSALIHHTILHADYTDPQSAADLAQMYGLPVPPNAARLQQQQQQMVQGQQPPPSGQPPAPPAQAPAPQGPPLNG